MMMGKLVKWRKLESPKKTDAHGFSTTKLIWHKSGSEPGTPRTIGWVADRKNPKLQMFSPIFTTAKHKHLKFWNVILQQMTLLLVPSQHCVAYSVQLRISEMGKFEVLAPHHTSCYSNSNALTRIWILYMYVILLENYSLSLLITKITYFIIYASKNLKSFRYVIEQHRRRFMQWDWGKKYEKLLQDEEPNHFFKLLFCKYSNKDGWLLIGTVTLYGTKESADIGGKQFIS